MPILRFAQTGYAKLRPRKEPQLHLSMDWVQVLRESPATIWKLPPTFISRVLSDG